jgi:putative CocE/NonD family hydrolase
MQLSRTLFVALALSGLHVAAADDAVRVEKDIVVAARDGTRLALDLYLPAADGPFPVLMARTPYNKSGQGAEAMAFARRGYAVVLNDCRGRYGSEGVWRMIVDDPADGYDVARWIVAQPWCAGKIGTFGTSYVGGTQHALACARAPGLACMIPVDSLVEHGDRGECATPGRSSCGS